MTGHATLTEEIRQKRDELREILHLGSNKVKQQWDELEVKWEDFVERARLRETSEDEDVVKLLGVELMKGYERLKSAVRHEESSEDLPPSLRGKVELLAYELWTQRGRPPGNAESDWYEAERQVLEQERRIEETDIVDGG